MFAVRRVSVWRVVLAVVFLSGALVVAPVDAAKNGTGCKKAGATAVTKGVTYRCQKSNGKLKWIETRVGVVAGSCAAGGICVVGDKGPGGGLVFYVGPTMINAVPGVSVGGKYLEAAPNTWNGGTSDAFAGWGCNGNLIGGADGTDVGSGAQNTKDIDIGCATSGIAADMAINLVFGGQSDWFLPSIGELNLMFTNLKARGVGDFLIAYYWSSSESTADSVRIQIFADGFQGKVFKNGTFFVRPIRAFG